jgi:NAD(P)-dependent dehydrogenase (short-subunit alcohol dehydrogenase family)
LDVLFANAGGGGFVPLGQITPEQFDETFGINVRGTLFTVQKALPLLNDGAAIVLSGSSAATNGTSAFSVYAASKAAIRSFGRTWAAELAGRGIRVNTIVPARPIRPVSVPLLQTPSRLKGSCGPSPARSRWDALASPRRSLMRCCSWPHPKAAL